MDIKNCTVQQWLSNEVDYLTILKDSEIWENIPLLNVCNLDNFKDESLVRFRGMVQDMYSPEYYFEQYEVQNTGTNEKSTKCGKFRDIISCEEDEIILHDNAMSQTKERQTYVVISTPAENDWVHNLEKSNHQKINTESPNKPVKRQYEGMDTTESPAQATSEIQKRQCSGSSREQPSQSNLVSSDHLLNCPLPNRPGKTCHVKMYKTDDSLKLNDVCEFVGFLSLNPSLIPESSETENFENQMEIQTHHPPPSLIPRIHCVTFKKIEHFNPLVPHKTISADRFEYVQKEMMILLTQLLLGDALAAEYLILHLISEVYLRKDLMALGKFSLNLSNVPQFENLNYPEAVYKFIELLVPKSHYLPLTLDNMNELAFVPKKDYECNRLATGILQLSANTHLLLDETKMNTGSLNAAGVKGVQALVGAIKNQKVVYDFNYYPIEFDCDIPFLIMSEGKSLLPSDCHVKLNPDQICMDTFEEILKAARHFLKPDLLDEMRLYLTQARMSKYEITDEVHELVQNEFVKMRQSQNATADDLHNLLVLARLVCLSRGKTMLDKDSWEIACNLERDRKSRFD